MSQCLRSLELSLATGAADTLDGQCREPRLLGDHPILLVDDRASRSVTIHAAQSRAWNLAVRSLRAVLIEDIEQHEFNTRSRLASHCDGPVRAMARPSARDREQRRQCDR